MSLKIIGAGFPRTGTSSLKIALEKLGYERCYHMKELLVAPENLHYWLDLERKRTTDYEGLFDGYDSTVDFPGYPFYKEFLAKYPDAKVILTVRPFEKWYQSVNATVRRAGPQTIGEKLGMLSKLPFSSRLRGVKNCIGFFKRMFFEKEFNGRFDDKAYAEEVFNRHIEDVKKNVPADQLLVYEISQGYGPLCEFLGKPMIDEPIPHANKKENFKEMVQKLMKGEMVHEE